MDFDSSEIVKNFEHKFKQKILKYIKAMYNHQSDLNKIENLEDRHKAACEKASISPKEEVMIEIFELKNDIVNMVIHEYMITQNPIRYYYLLTSQRMFWQLQLLINGPVNFELSREEQKQEWKMRSELADKCEALIPRIDRLKSEIYMTKEFVVKVADHEVRRRLTLEERIANRDKNAQGNK
jgi:hypothetical protein